MESIGTNSDEGIAIVASQEEQQSQGATPLETTASKVSEVVTSRACYVLPKCAERAFGSVGQGLTSFVHFFTSTYHRFFSVGNGYSSTNSVYADKTNEIMKNLAGHTERNFSYTLSLREYSGWSSDFHSGGGVEVYAGILEKIDFCLNNKEALNLKGYTDPKTGEYMSYENLTKEDVLAAMIATEMARSELSHTGSWLETSFLVTLVANLAKISQIHALNAFVYLYYSRVQTYEADQAGTALMAKAGYNPAAKLFLNDLHNQCRSYVSRALSHIYLTAPSCQARQSVVYPVARDWKALQLKAS